MGGAEELLAGDQPAAAAGFAAAAVVGDYAAVFEVDLDAAFVGVGVVSLGFVVDF